MGKEKWIQKAVEKPGSFTKQADKAGESVQAFARDVKEHPGEHTEKTEKRAQLAETLEGMHGGKKDEGSSEDRKEPEKPKEKRAMGDWLKEPRRERKKKDEEK